uniref:NAD(P)(+)--arginine ADP-ribosyltransferase n=1 Tax=Erpetoichthys calabaricus TaxID=27687 RepID=A0A8C4RPC4_ERPCA
MYLCSIVLQLLSFLIIVPALFSITYEDSYDDDYVGCLGKREIQVKQGYLSCEKKQNSIFKYAWDAAEIYWRNRVPPKLDRDTAIAVTAYTSNSFYYQLNAAVQGGVNQVTNGYFRSIHLLLTKAIQTLQNGKCMTTYRGIKVYIPLKRGELFRFGRFASSSKSRKVAEHFGSKMLFTIKTCFGVDITQYSLYKEESEVLIPPYEEFKVTDAHWNQITLMSTGKARSNKRCESMSPSCPYQPTWNTADISSGSGSGKYWDSENYY